MDDLHSPQLFSISEMMLIDDFNEYMNDSFKELILLGPDKASTSASMLNISVRAIDGQLVTHAEASDDVSQEAIENLKQFVEGTYKEFIDNV